MKINSDILNQIIFLVPDPLCCSGGVKGPKAKTSLELSIAPLWENHQLALEQAWPTPVPFPLQPSA